MIEGLKDIASGQATPLSVVSPESWENWLKNRDDAEKAWFTANRFQAEPGTSCAVPKPGGGIACVVAGIAPQRRLWDWAAVAASLPDGDYRLDIEPDAAEATRAALAWALHAHRDNRFRTSNGSSPAALAWPEACDRAAVENAAEATALVRSLISTPANLMGPAELAAAAENLGAAFNARTRVIAGENLLSANYPSIHAVGAGADPRRAPRLIDMVWGEADAPRVTLVGKGVCFDTGGLDIKPASAMKLMKKDMGGAANVLGLARMIMGATLPVRLRVLIPAVENSVSNGAMRPLDVIRTRLGKTIEIGHTDAEGRVILADALTEAAWDEPELIIDCATLTGAARVALGPDLPALFCNDEQVAEAAIRSAADQDDPLWRMPLWEPYGKSVEGRQADLTNAPESGAIGAGYAGAITAALFLQRFVEPKRPWIHIDMMAWNLVSRPGRPEGGEAMGMRALFDVVSRRFPAA